MSSLYGEKEIENKQKKSVSLHREMLRCLHYLNLKWIGNVFSRVPIKESNRARSWLSRCVSIHVRGYSSIFLDFFTMYRQRGPKRARAIVDTGPKKQQQPARGSLLFDSFVSSCLGRCSSTPFLSLSLIVYLFIRCFCSSSYHSYRSGRVGIAECPSTCVFGEPGENENLVEGENKENISLYSFFFGLFFYLSFFSIVLYLFIFGLSVLWLHVSCSKPRDKSIHRIRQDPPLEWK